MGGIYHWRKICEGRNPELKDNLNRIREHFPSSTPYYYANKVLGYEQWIIVERFARGRFFFMRDALKSPKSRLVTKIMTLDEFDPMVPKATAGTKHSPTLTPININLNTEDIFTSVSIT